MALIPPSPRTTKPLSARHSATPASGRSDRSDSSFRCCMESAAICNAASWTWAIRFASTFPTVPPGTHISCAAWPSAQPTSCSCYAIFFGRTGGLAASLCELPLQSSLIHAQANLLDDLDSESVEPHHLARMIGQQPDGSEAEIGQDLRADAGFLLRPRFTFTGRIMLARAGSGLVQIHQHARAFLRDPLDR